MRCGDGVGDKLGTEGADVGRALREKALWLRARGYRSAQIAQKLGIPHEQLSLWLQAGRAQQIAEILDRTRPS